MKTETGNARQLQILGNAVSSSQREIFAETVKQWGQRLGYCSIFAAVPAILASHLTEARSDEAKKPEASIAGRVARRLEKLNIRGSSPALLRRQSEYRLPHQKGSFDTWTTLGGNDDCPGRQIPGGIYTAAAPYIDSGDTTGANSTVNTFYVYFGYQTLDSLGPDHVYSFILTGRGPNPQIAVSTTSSAYRPLIYVLEGGIPGACPAGTGMHVFGLMRSSSESGTAVINSQLMNFLPKNVPLYLFVDSTLNDSTGSGPYTIRLWDVTIAPAPPAPIDSPEFFVNRHYFDFLSRSPDQGGQDYWTNEITNCGTDAVCIHNRRIGVSAAFFIESEFQNTGYFVYRFYKASFGRQPTVTEFWKDRSNIANLNLEAGRQSFAQQWVQRPEFLQAYPNTMSNTQYVNKLFDTAGLTASRFNAQRQQEISAMNTGRSRAAVLRNVIEIPDFRNVPDPANREQITLSQFNPAFVLMQYFGYLRRNPDQAGYDFWLDLLNNREINNYRSMVCAFITSTEYQLRFGSTVTRSNADCGQ